MPEPDEMTAEQMSRYLQQSKKQVKIAAEKQKYLEKVRKFNEQLKNDTRQSDR